MDIDATEPAGADSRAEGFFGEGPPCLIEDKLMEMVAGGDEGAFERIYEMWGKRVMAFAYRALSDYHEAQDITQDTFAQLYRVAPSYKGEGKFQAYLFKIARNFVRERLRELAREGGRVDSLDEMMEAEGANPPPIGAEISPEDDIIASIDMEDMLEQLPPRQREALMITVSGLSYTEGAAMMDVSVDAFAQTVMRGRRLLRSLRKKRQE